MTSARMDELARRAREVRANAYAPYSNFAVGAAVLAGSGTIYVGANVENASFPAGLCAEGSAVSAAISAGEKKVLAVCVVTSMSPPAAPCGVCRQTLAEFGPTMEVGMATPDASVPPVITTMADLLPGHFNGDVL